MRPQCWPGPQEILSQQSENQTPPGPLKVPSRGHSPSPSLDFPNLAPWGPFQAGLSHHPAPRTEAPPHLTEEGQKLQASRLVWGKLRQVQSLGSPRPINHGSPSSPKEFLLLQDRPVPKGTKWRHQNPGHQL